MDLPIDLISEFVKVTKDDTKTKTEKTIYGTVVDNDGSICVQLDGSNLYTPMITTVDVVPGDRVTIMLKNHTAIVTGNLTSPAARTGMVDALSVEMSKQISNLDERQTVSEQNIANIQDNISSIDSSLETFSDRLTEDEINVSNLQNGLTYAEQSITNIQANLVNLDERQNASEQNIVNIQNDLSVIFNLIYPVGSLYISAVDVDPGELFGGVWEALSGRFLLASSEEYPLGSEGGEAEHTLTVDELPASVYGEINDGYGWSSSSDSELQNISQIGGGLAHNNMPPYISVNIWKRIE